MKLGLTVLVVAAFASGCSPVASIRPLYTDSDLQKPIVDPRIEGEWVSPNTEEPENAATREMWLRWKITSPEKPYGPYSTYSAEFRLAKADPEEGDMASTYDVRLVAIDDKLFFDAEFRNHTQKQLSISSTDVLGLVPAHLVGRIWVQQDLLRAAFLKPNWVEEHWPTGFQRFHSSNYGDDDIVITGSTQELRDFLVQSDKDPKALAYVVYFCRAGTDCTERAVEDALARTPEDDDVLDGASKFFSAERNYTRAVLLREQRVKREPDDISLHQDLSKALLFSRDFSGARRELAAVQKLVLGDPPTTADALTSNAGRIYAQASEDLVWNYFLEGRYPDAVSAAIGYKPGKNHASVNPLLLRYFSLVRLGRQKEAESLLNEESEEFRGSAEEHLLFLTAQGRVSDVPPNEAKTEPARRASYFAALQELATGKTVNAKFHLANATGEGSDGMIDLAARIELERLEAKAKK